MKVVHMMVSNLSGKENRLLVLKSYLLSWSRISQFEHIRRTGQVLDHKEP